MRFFHASAMAGRLHLLDIGDYGPWQPGCIRYDEEDVLDQIAGRLISTKARTVEELDATLESSRGKSGDPGPLGSITVWISEDLLDAAAVRAFFAEKGKEGGQIRAKRLSPERRKAIARKAAEIRWKKKEGRA